MTFISLGHARFQEEDKSTWEPTPEMFTLLLQSLGVLSAEQPANTHTAQQHLVTIAIAQQLNLSPTYRQRKQSLGLSQNNSSQFFESEDPLSQQYVLTTSDVEHKYLCKIFTGTEIFRHSAVIALPGRRLDSMKRLVQTAIENELGAIEWVRTECTSIKTPEILGYGYHLGCVPEMSEWLDRFGILGFILTSFPRSGIVYRGPGEGSPPLESSAKRHLCDQIAKLMNEMRRHSQEQIAGFALPDMSFSRNSGSTTLSRGQDGKIFKPFGIRSRFDLILGRMQEKISGSPSPYTQASTTSSSTTFSEFDPGDMASDPSEQEEDSDAEDEATRRRKSFKGLVGSIIRRSSGSRCKHPSPEDTATRTSSRGKGKAITKQARVIVPFSRTGGHPFPFVAINHFKTVDLLCATPKSMIFTKETRRAWREGTRIALEKARSLSETKRSSSHSVSWIKRRSTIENKSVTATDSGTGSQASELKELKTNDDPQEPQK
ncbi:hypothetical protein BGZ52_002144, partial [Haplosporangium bisporale]